MEWHSQVWHEKHKCGFFRFFCGKFCRYKNYVYLCITKNDGAIAQLVEQRTENPCVPGSTPGGTTQATCFRRSLFLCLYELITAYFAGGYNNLNARAKRELRPHGDSTIATDIRRSFCFIWFAATPCKETPTPTHRAHPTLSRSALSHRNPAWNLTKVVFERHQMSR